MASSADIEYRKLLPKDYFFGLSEAGKVDERLIVYDSWDGTVGREYEKKFGTWRCIRCKEYHKKTIFIKILKHNVVLEPSNHECFPHPIDDILEMQHIYEKRYRHGSVELNCISDIVRDDGEYEMVERTSYKFDMSPSGLPFGRLIVRKGDSAGSVYHYKRWKNGWICEGCFTMNTHVLHGNYVGYDLFLPKAHLCSPISGEDSAAAQAKLKCEDESSVRIFDEKLADLQIVSKANYQFGITRSCKDINSKNRLIICDPDTHRRAVFEYTLKDNNLWQCFHCSAKKKYDTYAIMKNDVLYADLSEHCCYSVPYYRSTQKQLLLYHGSTKIAQKLAKKIGFRMPLVHNNQITEASPNFPRGKTRQRIVNARNLCSPEW